jgi:hypothetical protein
MTPTIRAYCFYADLLRAAGLMPIETVVAELTALVRRGWRAR